MAYKEEKKRKGGGGGTTNASFSSEVHLLDGATVRKGG